MNLKPEFRPGFAKISTDPNGGVLANGRVLDSIAVCYMARDFTGLEGSNDNLWETDDDERGWRRISISVQKVAI
jgi:hypothetical protein